MELEQTAVIVTGGASGLGAATARHLSAKGANVTIFDLNSEIGKQTAKETNSYFVSVDVTDDKSVETAFEAAQAKHGVARILVNCAGIAPAARVIGKDGVPHSLDLYRKVIEINLVGTFNVMSKFAAKLASLESIDQERGVIINTASIAAYDGQIGQVAYASSKAGIVGLTLTAARDLAQHKIRVMTIAPGIFLTPMVASFAQEVRDALGRQVPHPSRLGEPAEYAQLVDSIIQNSMLNGEVIRLDGAIRMAPR